MHSRHLRLKLPREGAVRLVVIVELRGVLGCQVRVLGAAPSAKVLDLHDRGEDAPVELIVACRFIRATHAHVHHTARTRTSRRRRGRCTRSTALPDRVLVDVEGALVPVFLRCKGRGKKKLVLLSYRVTWPHAYTSMYIRTQVEVVVYTHLQERPFHLLLVKHFQPSPGQFCVLGRECLGGQLSPAETGNRGSNFGDKIN